MTIEMEECDKIYNSILESDSYRKKLEEFLDSHLVRGGFEDAEWAAKNATLSVLMSEVLNATKEGDSEKEDCLKKLFIKTAEETD